MGIYGCRGVTENIDGEGEDAEDAVGWRHVVALEGI